MSRQNEAAGQPEELIDIVGLLTDFLRTLRRMWIWVVILAIYDLLFGLVAYGVFDFLLED